MKLSAKLWLRIMFQSLLLIVLLGVIMDVQGTPRNILIRTLGIYAVINIIVSLFISMLSSRIISKPLTEFAKTMKKISGGDFTVEIKSKSNDEIGKLGTLMSDTIKNIKDSISGVKNNGLEINESASALSETSNEMVTAVNEVSSAIQEVANGASSQAQDLVDVVNLVSDLTKELDATKDRLVKATKEVKNAEAKAVDGNSQVDVLIGTLVSVKEAFDKVVEKVDNLSGAVSKIGNITDAINDISEQTNLLALNAAIEAARAGEHGKGFAVVAEEVRKLAEESQKSSEEIMNLVKDIGNETKEVKTTSDSVGDLLDGQAEAANNTAIVLYDIVDAVNAVVPLMDDANSSINTVVVAKDEVLDKVQSVSAVAEEVSASSEQISASSQEMLASAEEVKNHSDRVAQVSSDLREKVEKFTV